MQHFLLQLCSQEKTRIKSLGESISCPWHEKVILDIYCNSFVAENKMLEEKKEMPLLQKRRGDLKCERVSWKKENIQSHGTKILVNKIRRDARQERGWKGRWDRNDLGAEGRNRKRKDNKCHKIQGRARGGVFSFSEHQHQPGFRLVGARRKTNWAHIYTNRKSHKVLRRRSRLNLWAASESCAASSVSRRPRWKVYIATSGRRNEVFLKYPIVFRRLLPPPSRAPPPFPPSWAGMRHLLAVTKSEINHWSSFIVLCIFFGCCWFLVSLSLALEGEAVKWRPGSGLDCLPSSLRPPSLLLCLLPASCLPAILSVCLLSFLLPTCFPSACLLACYCM